MKFLMVIQSRTFINALAMMVGLAQAAAFTNVLGQLANTLSTLCCIRNHKNHTFPKTNYSRKQHSSPLPLVCFDERRKNHTSVQPGQEHSAEAGNGDDVAKQRSFCRLFLSKSK